MKIRVHVTADKGAAVQAERDRRFHCNRKEARLRKYRLDAIWRCVTVILSRLGIGNHIRHAEKEPVLPWIQHDHTGCYVEMTALDFQTVGLPSGLEDADVLKVSFEYSLRLSATDTVTIYGEADTLGKALGFYHRTYDELHARNRHSTARTRPRVTRADDSTVVGGGHLTG